MATRQLFADMVIATRLRPLAEEFNGSPLRFLLPSIIISIKREIWKKRFPFVCPF
ncbi:hypothetical protein SCH4B_2451 [Ruegeria sp. TrichCH4B]|nr:hypothetical protein SCH4B_2451 [Ruegeria sp. TrichCH4B]